MSDQRVTVLLEDLRFVLEQFKYSSPNPTEQFVRLREVVARADTPRAKCPTCRCHIRVGGPCICCDSGYPNE